MSNHRTSKGTKATHAGRLVAGARKRFKNGKQPILVAGVSTTVDDALSELQALIDHRAAVVAAQALAKARLADERAALPALEAYMNAFTATVRFMFGNQPEALADFGMAPPRERTPLTAEQQAVTAAKRLATRAARGTRGPRARREIHGHVTANLVVEPADPKKTGV
jgi:hypothetical protein